MSVEEMDVREVPRAERHPRIFARVAVLEAAESFVLSDNHA